MVAAPFIASVAVPPVERLRNLFQELSGESSFTALAFYLQKSERPTDRQESQGLDSEIAPQTPVLVSYIIHKIQTQSAPKNLPLHSGVVPHLSAISPQSSFH